MAITFFQYDESSSSLEFLSDYFEDHPEIEGQDFEILAISPVKSGKGYLLTTPEFQVFYFKKEKIILQLLQALEHYCGNGYGPKVICRVDSTIKSLHLLGIDEDNRREWMFSQGKYSIVGGPGISPKKALPSDGSNPFISRKFIPSPLSPSPTPENVNEPAKKTSQTSKKTPSTSQNNSQVI